jgi:hypothetical protein
MSLRVLEMVQALEDRGFTASEAEGIVEQTMNAIEDSDLVTKSFLKTELAELKTELKTEFVREIAQLEKNLIKWMLGLQLGSIGLILSLILGLIYFLHSNN